MNKRQRKKRDKKILKAISVFVNEWRRILNNFRKGK
jgi:hypothetical protein